MSFRRLKGRIPGMKLVYTSHAKERMAERGITASEVEQVINSPDIHTALASRVIVVKYAAGQAA